MHYYIDGYNLLFRVSQEGNSLEKKRYSLIALLNEELTFLKGRATIVFDSAEQIREFHQSAILENLEVVYAPKGLTADAYIIELVDQSFTPKALTVVTSDNGLARQCKHIGALHLSIEQFIAFVMKKNGSPENVKPLYKESKAELERLRKIFEERLDK